MLRMKKKFESVFLHSLLIVLYSSFFFLFSCRKADRDTDTSTEMVSDNAFSAYFFNDLFRQVHQFALSDSALNAIGSYFISDTACIDTIIHTNIPGSFPDTVTVTYGTGNGTACSDGNLRRGKLKIIFSGEYGTALKNITVYPENYYLNDYKMEGKIYIYSKGRNGANNLYFSLEIMTGKVSNDSIRLEYYAPSNGQTSGFEREWISGETTSSVSDDIFQLSGTYGGTASKGTTYKTEITSALKDQFDCKWFTGGKEKLFPSNLSPRETNYGNGCDNKSTVTINGKEYEVTLLP